MGMTRNLGGQLPFLTRLRQAMSTCIREDNGCLIWTKGLAGNGLYPVIKRNNLQTRVSRILLEISGNPPPSPLHLACHKCDNPRCVEVAHLFWGTAKENMEDASKKLRMSNPKSLQHRENIRKGTQGEKSHKHKLTEKQVMAIRKDPRYQDEIAKSYGVSQTAISRIKRKQSWRHL